MQFTIDPMGAARLFLLARGRGGENHHDDLSALSAIITQFSLVGFSLGLEKAKEVYREVHSGGCEILSKGGDCKCFLCRCDDLRSKAAE